AERQIANGYIDPTTGQPYANTISPAWTHADGSTVDPIGADGFFVMPGVINLDDQAGVGIGGGNFSVNSVPPVPDDTVPGIPGTKTLINDLTGFTPIKAYRETAAGRPYISRVLPTVNYGYAFADDDVVTDIKDGAVPLNAGSAALTINGVPQTITANKTNDVTTIRRASSLSNLLFSGANTNTLIYSFAEQANTVTVTNIWTFTVPRYTRPIPPANKVLATDVSGSGFHVRARQIDRSGDANQGNGGRYSGNGGSGNNMPRPEIELADGYINPTNNLPFANLLDPTFANLDGSYDVPDVLNFNHSTGTGQFANGGIFNGDA